MSGQNLPLIPLHKIVKEYAKWKKRVRNISTKNNIEKLRLFNNWLEGYLVRKERMIISLWEFRSYHDIMDSLRKFYVALKLKKEVEAWLVMADGEVYCNDS